jgi:predicted enzyme related to lactoylglutathione lyase
MLRGLANVSYFTDDLDAATEWYTEVLGIEPYFTVPGGYVEYRVGDYQHELGLVNRAYAPQYAKTNPAGVVLYWHVDDVQASLDRLVSLGAKQLDAAQDRGHLFITAAVIDPFGNVLGIMSNPHYRDVLAATGPFTPAAQD